MCWASVACCTEQFFLQRHFDKRKERTWAGSADAEAWAAAGWAAAEAGWEVVDWVAAADWEASEG